MNLCSPGSILARAARYALGAMVVVLLSLGIGILGYHVFGGLGWVDSLLNASFILTGMGPVDPMKSTAGKLFATFYALYSGIAFLSMMAVLLAPIIHRGMHKFHLDAEEDSDDKTDPAKTGK